MKFLNEGKFSPPIQNHQHPCFIFMLWGGFSNFLSLSGGYRRKRKEEKQSPRNLATKRGEKGRAREPQLY